MTDFLSRLAARITAPESGLRPNAPTRFEPVSGLAGEAGLFEIDVERELRAPAVRQPVATGHEPTAFQPGAPAPQPGPGPASQPASASPPELPGTPAPVAPPAAVERGVQAARGQHAERPSDPPSEPRVVRSPTEASDPPPSAVDRPDAAASAEDRIIEQHHHRERVIERLVAVEGSGVPEGNPSEMRPTRPAMEAGAPPRGEAMPARAPQLQTPPRPPGPSTQQPQSHMAARESARALQVSSPEPAPPAPVVVRIDRLEVRVGPPRSAPATAVSRTAQPVTDLDSYLSNLDGRRS